jgi:hypothetical protein
MLAWMVPSPVKAQVVPVGDLRDDQYRLLQLYSDSLDPSSMMNRPLRFEALRSLTERAASGSDAWWASSPTHMEQELPWNFRAGLFEPVSVQTFNSHLPHGGNNGAAWYGRGLTSELRGGAYLTSDYLTVSFRPHLAWQQNRTFEDPRFIPLSDGEPTWQGIVTNIDMPFRFGPDPYSTFDLGESSIRIHFKSVEFGAGSEAVWWGPGIQHALVLGNNAPGVKQVFLGTRSPLRVPFIGHFEFRYIAGWPKDSKYYPQETPQRFLSALHVVYSPSFIPGLSVGGNRLSHMYVPDDGITSAELFTSLPFSERQLTGNNPDENEMASVFFRWLFPEASAEVYGSYFREDSFYDSRDLFLQPDHDRAYTIGFQKLLHTGVMGLDFVRVNLELNNLVPNRVQEVRPQTWYYRHSRIRQGHTNRGQVLGASIGPGSGSQYLGIDGYFNSGKAGFFLERVEVNDYFHYKWYETRPAGSGYKDIWRNRVNINYGLRGLYRIGPLLMQSSITFNHNLNYGRYDYGDLDVTFDTFDPQDVLNVQVQFGVRYLLE